MTNTNEHAPVLIDLKQIRARFVPLSSRTLWRMIASGKFPKADLVQGRKIRLWKRETIQQWIEHATRESVN